MAAQTSNTKGEQKWTFGGPTPEWQVQVGRTDATHIFYSPEDVREHLRKQDIAAAFDEDTPQGEIVISVRKVVRHGENSIRVHSYIASDTILASKKKPTKTPKSRVKIKPVGVALVNRKK